MRSVRRHFHAAAVLAMLSLFVLIMGCEGLSSPSSPRGSEPEPPADNPDVRLQVVNLKEFEAALAKHKGKVVAVDFWATWCIPCRKEFHRLVEMQKKYGPEGLVCISMTLDKPDSEAEAVGFLKKEKAAFENFLINENPRGPTGWADRWDFDNPPAAHVYGRDGKLARKFVRDTENSFEPDEVEAFVRKLLREG